MTRADDTDEAERAVNRTVKTDHWQLTVPETLSRASPLLCIPTVHPRGDQRVLRCAQVALNAGFRVKFIWLGAGKASSDSAASEVLLAPAASFWQRFRKLSTLGKKAADCKPDAWHIHDFYMLRQAMRWHRRTNGPVIYDVHEYYALYYSAKLPVPELIRSMVERWLSRYQVRSARRLGGANVVAEAMAEPFRGANVPVAVTPNLPLGAPFEANPPKPLTDRNKHAIHLGSMSGSYGMELLVRLASEAHRRKLGIQFDFMAKFPSEAEGTRFAELMEREGRPPNVRLLPVVPAHAVASLLSNYGIGLSALQAGDQNDISVGAKFYEYVLMGLVVVGTQRDAHQSFLAKWGVSELRPDDDVQGLIESLEHVVSVPEDYSDKAAASSKAARESLYWETASAPALSQLYAKVFRGRVKGLPN